MIATKTETVTWTGKTVSNCTCDLCGRITTKYNDGGEWAENDRFHTDQVSMFHKVGSTYPEGANVEVTKFDVCPECWTTRVMEWMKAQGATPRVYDLEDGERNSGPVAT